MKQLPQFEQALIPLGTFDTVEGFWAVYSHLARSNNLPPASEYFLFKTGIKPMWEDAANQDGGKWIIRVKKPASPRCWEQVVLALLGDQFGASAGDDICGLVVSTKANEDCISVWNRSANNKDVTIRIRDVLKETLDIPVNAAFEYKPHHVSIDHVATLARGGSQGSTHSHRSTPGASESPAAAGGLTSAGTSALVKETPAVSLHAAAASPAAAVSPAAAPAAAKDTPVSPSKAAAPKPRFVHGNRFGDMADADDNDSDSPDTPQ